MFTLKKREDKKEEAVYVTCFACFLFTLSRRLMDHGFTAQKKVVTIQDSTQARCFASRIPYKGYVPWQDGVKPISCLSPTI